MQAIREIYDIEQQSLVLNLPKEFIKHRVEVIVLPIDEEEKSSAKAQSSKRLASFSTPMKVDKMESFSREELHAR